MTIEATMNSGELAWMRAGLYQLLSRVYATPTDQNGLKSLAAWVIPLIGAREAFGLMPRQIRHGFEVVAGLLSRPDGSWEELGKSLSTEFTRLFRGLNRSQSPPPPYESVYRETSELIFGESTVAVRQEYHCFGLEVTDRLGSEPPDHISFELEFMGLLCSQESEAWQRGEAKETQRLLATESRFLEEHLSQWVPAFCQNIRKADTSGFYRGLAEVTEGWIYWDQKITTELVRQISKLQSPELSAASGRIVKS